LIWEIKYQQQFYTGIIVQVPLPAHISQKKVAEAIDPKKDVDGFHPMTKFRPCTPFGIYEYLGACGFQFSGSNVAVIGRSDIVGKPMAKILTDADATVTLCHSKTKNLDSILRDKDLIVCSVGKPNFLNCYSLHMPIVDVGINFNEQGKMVGDCFNTEGRMVTPVPGGVGLLTRVALLENLWEAAKYDDGN
jgi:methylenetetrahydrofolate dehydrogenase (NADP+)/methenyltetrahydrofolate cyclohydrolase